MQSLIILIIVALSLSTNALGNETQSLDLPPDYYGTWLLADGSKQWHISLYEDVIIYEGELYEHYISERKNNKYIIVLDDIKLWLKLKEDVLQVKEENGEWEECKQYDDTKAVYEKGSDCPLEFSTEQDTTTIKGYIVNYNIKKGKVGKISFFNSLLGQKEQDVFEINEKGVFEIRIPLSFTQQITVRLPDRRYTKPIFHPGEQVIIQFDKKQVLTFGKYARLTQEYPYLRELNYETSQKVIDSIVTSDKNTHLASSDKMLTDLLNQWSTSAVKYNVSPTMRQYGEDHLKYSCAYIRLFYRVNKSIEEKKLKKEGKTYAYEKLTKNDFDFVDALPIDEQSSLMQHYFYYFVNMLRGYDCLQLSDSVYASKDLDLIYSSHHEKIIELLGQRGSLVSDVIISQMLCPCATRPALDSVKSTCVNDHIRTSFIKEYIYQCNDDVHKLAKENQSKTNYSLPKTPTTESNKLFDEMIKPFEGKVIYIDFWATWCGPCRDDIMTIKPLKKDLEDRDDIVFMYITNESSPEEPYKSFIPDIKGQHYRVSHDKWNLITSKFGITGIPHCLIVDKNGKVVNNNDNIRVGNPKLKEILLKYANKK